jgi:uncharacterized membrane protein HdeD (DUF308 family)
MSNKTPDASTATESAVSGSTATDSAQTDSTAKSTTRRQQIRDLITYGEGLMRGLSGSTATDSAETDSTAKSTIRYQQIRDLITYGGGLMRGLSAMGVAVLLFFIPDKSAPMMANKMGYFWLFSSIALLRLNRDDPARQNLGTRTTTIIAVIGILTGLLVITRGVAGNFIPEVVLATLLGVVILITGLLHLLSEFRMGGAASQGHRALHALLGLFEVVLGLMLVISPLDRSQWLYEVATIWALIFGALAIGETVAKWLHARKVKKEASAEADAATVSTS